VAKQPLSGKVTASIQCSCRRQAGRGRIGTRRGRAGSCPWRSAQSGSGAEPGSGGGEGSACDAYINERGRMPTGDRRGEKARRTVAKKMGLLPARRCSNRSRPRRIRYDRIIRSTSSAIAFSRRRACDTAGQRNAETFENSLENALRNVQSIYSYGIWIQLDLSVPVPDGSAGAEQHRSVFQPPFPSPTR
jgi:hypothetical protein